MWYLVDAAKCDALECEGAVRATTGRLGWTTEWTHHKVEEQKACVTRAVQSIIGKGNFRCIWTRLPPYSCLDHKLWVGPGRAPREHAVSATNQEGRGAHHHRR